MKIVTKEHFIEVTPEEGMYLHWSENDYTDGAAYFPISFDTSKITEVSEIPESSSENEEEQSL